MYNGMQIRFICILLFILFSDIVHSLKHDVFDCIIKAPVRFTAL